jgi:hypothetical protein
MSLGKTHRSHQATDHSFDELMVFLNERVTLGMMIENRSHALSTSPSMQTGLDLLLVHAFYLPA